MLLLELNSVNQLELPCRAICEGSSLHVFIDASSKAYSVDVNSNSSVMILSKARVTACCKNKLTVLKLKLSAFLWDVD